LGRNKNIIQIELNESLRRHRDELRSEIEGLGEPEIGDANAADDLKFRTHEMNSVNNAIGTLTKKVQGVCSSCYSFDMMNSQHDRHGESNRQTHA
jgi:structural maintenance of chromosome 3 (chondroitin sulfate proteoglycan 6)